jgi:MFS family permease
VLNLVGQYRGLPRPVYFIFAARIVDAACCFVGPLLTIILTLKIGLSAAAAGTTVGVLSLLSVGALALGGKLADLIGRKLTIALFSGCAIAAYAVCGMLAPSPLMLGILVTGVTFLSGAGPALDALVADLASTEQRTAAFSLLYLGWNIGFAAGPAIGGLLLARHLDLVFFGDAATALAALLIVLVFVPEPGRRPGAQPARSTADAADTAEAGEAAETGGIAGVLLRRPGLLVLCVLTLGYSFAYSQWGFLLPLQLTLLFPASGAGWYGLLAGFNGLVVIVFNPLLMLLFRRRALHRILCAGGVLYAVGFGFLGLASAVPLFFALAFVFTLGEIANAISTVPLLMSRTPLTHRGRMGSVYQVVMVSGQALGPVVVGQMAGRSSLAVMWGMVGCVALLSACLVPFMARVERDGSRRERKAR